MDKGIEGLILIGLVVFSIVIAALGGGIKDDEEQDYPVYRGRD